MLREDYETKLSTLNQLFKVINSNKNKFMVEMYWYKSP